MKKLLVLFLALAINANAEIVPAGGDLQTAINNNTDGVIELQEGTYEGGFVVDAKSNLTIKGKGDATIIKGVGAVPATHTIGVFTGNQALVAIKNSTGIIIKDFVVDADLKLGNENETFGIGVGIENANVDVDAVDVKNLRRSDGIAAQHGRAIAAYANSGTYTLNISNCTIDEPQKNGIDIRGGKWTVKIKENQITGSTATALQAQNGIVLWDFDGTANIENNFVGGYDYDNAGYWDNSAYGLLLSVSDTSKLVVKGNTVSESNTGIYAEGDTEDVTISENTVVSTSEAGNYGVYVATENALIEKNDIEGMNDAGISVEKSAKIIDNQIYDCAKSIETTYDVQASGNVTVRDTQAPNISGIKTKKVKDKRYRLVYTIIDDSNSSSEVVTLKRADAKKKKYRVFKTIRQDFAPNGQRKVWFNLNKKSTMIYRACVVATDVYGNQSKERCTQIK